MSVNDKFYKNLERLEREVKDDSTHTLLWRICRKCPNTECEIDHKIHIDNLVEIYSYDIISWEKEQIAWVINYGHFHFYYCIFFQ